MWKGKHCICIDMFEDNVVWAFINLPANCFGFVNTYGWKPDRAQRRSIRRSLRDRIDAAIRDREIRFFVVRWQDIC